MSHLLSFTPSGDYLRHNYGNSRCLVTLVLGLNSNYSNSDKIPLRMRHIPHCVLQQTVPGKRSIWAKSTNLEVSTTQFCPSLPLFPPFYVEILYLWMFLPPIHIHPPHKHLTNSTRLRIQNILLDTQQWYFTVAWQTEFKEGGDFLREVSPSSFHITHSFSV